MTIFIAHPDLALLDSGSADLIENTDGRLRFKAGKYGVATARFMVTTGLPWRKIRLTYRRPGNNLRLENYVIARLNQISKTSLASETLTFASTQGHVTDSDEIRQILGVTTILEPLDYDDFFFEIEIVMRRSPLLVAPDFLVAEAITLSGVHTFLQKENQQEPYEPQKTQTAETPSVPIPPPSENEVAAISSLRDFARGLSEFGVLTPSPEFILAELATTAPGFD